MVQIADFKQGAWSSSINVKDFISLHITPYTGNSSFLVGPTERTKQLWDICCAALKEERERKGLRSVNTKIVSSITAFNPGYINKDLEVIVGLQTDELLQRAIKPFGGFNIVKKALADHGLKPSDEITECFSKYVKTHNDGVFDAYTDEIRRLRTLGFLTGLPDNYGRGRIIGDYRRVALYGINRLIQEKQKDLDSIIGPMSDATIRLREEVSEQIRALYAMIALGEMYNLDISRPAQNAHEAVQWTYMAYLAAV